MFSVDSCQFHCSRLSVVCGLHLLDSSADRASPSSRSPAEESSGRVRRKSPPEGSTGGVHRRGPHMTERREQWCIGEMTCRWAAGGLPVTCQGLIEHAGHVTNPLACMHNGTVLTRAISRIAGPGLLSPAINTRGQQPSASIEVSRSTL